MNFLDPLTQAVMAYQQQPPATAPTQAQPDPMTAYVNQHGPQDIPWKPMENAIPEIPQVPPQPPPKPGTGKSQMWKQLLSGFLLDFGTGLTAAANARPGAGFEAGMGAAITAPWQRQQETRKMELEEARQKLYEAQQQNYMAQLNPRVQQILSRAQLNSANAELVGARTGTEAGTNLRGMAEVEGVRANAAKNRMISTPTGLYRLGDDGNPQLVQGSDPRINLTITPEIAEATGLQSMVGQTMPIQTINAISQATGRNIHIVQDKEGVHAYNIGSGEKKKIGDLPPTRAIGQFFPQLDEYGRILGYVNPASGMVVEQPEQFAGARKIGVAGGEMQNRVSLANLIEDADALMELAERNKETFGPFSGRAAEALINYAPEMLQREFPELVNDETQKIVRAAANARQQLLYAMSGKQINENEYKRLTRLIPSVNVSYDTFRNRMILYRNELQRSLERRQGKGEWRNDGWAHIMDEMDKGKGSSAKPQAKPSAEAPTGGGKHYVYDPKTNKMVLK